MSYIVNKAYIVIIIICLAFLITLSILVKDRLDKRRRKDKEIIKLGRNSLNYFSLSVGFIWILFLTTWITLFSKLIKDTYHALKPEYIKNIYQLFDLTYLESLRSLFYQNSMLKELLAVVYYQSSLFKYIVWTFLSLFNAMIFLNIGLFQNSIYEEGIRANGKLICWNRVSNYAWGSKSEKKLFGKGEYYDLALTLKQRNFFHLYNEVELRVNLEDKDLVSDILKKYLEENNDAIS